MGEHVIFSLHRDDWALGAPGIVRIQDEIKAGSDRTMEVREHDVPGVITVTYLWDEMELWSDDGDNPDQH